MGLSADAVISAASGLGGILVGSGIVVAVVKSKFTQVDALTRDLTALKDERVAAIEKRMQAFEGSCQARHDRLTDALNKVEHMAANLENIVGWTKKLDGKIDRMAEVTSAASARADGQAKWLDNLDKAHNEHVRDRGVHHNG